MHMRTLVRAVAVVLTPALVFSQGAKTKPMTAAGFVHPVLKK
jgi:hypothetical protein